MKAGRLDTLKKGDYFTRKPIEEPTESRTEKKNLCIRFDDFCRSVSLKGSTLVYTDFTF